MNAIKFTLFFIVSFFINLFAQAQPTIRVMTYNIRLDVASDGENGWNNRKEHFASMIRFYHPDIVGLQETQKHQIEYLARVLPDYVWFGVGRDDGKTEGEFMSIFYRKEKFDTIRTSTFWCSQTPSHPGLGWDAVCNRIVTWGKFREKKTQRSFFFFNTHLDHLGKTARKESARLLKDSIDAITNHEPVVITGDFNSRPSDDPYQTIISDKSKRKFFDTRFHSQEQHHGPNGTFNAFNIQKYADEPIDYIFVSEGTTVLRHGTLTDSFYGRIPSDHFPVITEIKFPIAQ